MGRVKIRFNTEKKRGVCSKEVGGTGGTCAANIQIREAHPGVSASWAIVLSLLKLLGHFISIEKAQILVASFENTIVTIF